MSTSYDKHKSQVEAARKGDGKFGSYESGESAAALDPRGFEPLEYEDLERLGDHLENELDGDWRVVVVDGFASVAEDSEGEPQFDIAITEDGRIDARFESGYHTDSEMLGSPGELEEFAEKALSAHHAERQGRNVDGDRYGPFREVDRREVETGEDSGYDEPSDRAVDIIAEQGVTGYSRIGEPVADERSSFGHEFTPHRVTLKNDEGDEVEFPHMRGAAYGDEPPTAAQVVGSVADDARMVEDYDDDEDFAREVMGFDPVDQFDDPEGWEQVKRDRKNIRDNAESLRGFVGDEAYEKLLWGEEED